MKVLRFVFLFAAAVRARLPPPRGSAGWAGEWGEYELMARLMVQYGKGGKKHTPFHPTLRLRDTGYARGHWQEMHFRDGLFTGSRATIRTHDVAAAIAHYFSELRRMDYRVVSE